jgi:hypothetical protein
MIEKYKQYYTSSLFNIKNNIDFLKKTTFINVFTNEDIQVFNKINDKIVIYNSEIHFFNYLDNVKNVIASNVEIYSDNIKIRLYLLKNGVIPFYINKYNMFDLNHINDNILLNINKNIDHFNLFINEYKNILFICGDYPSYGGAATNCNHLENYYKKKGHNTYSYYHDYKNININNINFNPNLIILKSFIKINLREKFNCPIIYLIGGIYINELDKYYFNINKKKEQYKYINNSVIEQIKNSDYSFSNSSHTQEILKKYYNIDTELFYSSFIQFKDTNIIVDDNFNNRKYDYGLIVSNFDRKIKNIEKSINFLKNKKNVILIGKNSNKYSNYGFECIDLIDNNKMIDYYKNIKYIVQDSFYESCSNVKIEGLFNGCKIVKKNIIISSTQYAGYGGAACNAYNLVKYFRKKGYNTVGIFFHNDINVNYDPDKIGGIFIYTYNNMINNIIIKDTINYLNGYPDICFGKNYIAPLYCKKIFNCYTVYLVSGINHFSNENYYNNKIDAKKFLKDDFINTIDIKDEINCINSVDLIVLNSYLCMILFKKLYKNYLHKIYKNPIDTTSINDIKYSNTVKEYDIIISCSNLMRVEKNNMFLINILKNPIFDKYKKCIIGENYNNFLSIKNSICLGLIEQNKSIEYLSKSKLLLFPSLFDANSNTVREAVHTNCFPLITHNIGFSELFPSFLICDTYTDTEWTNKIIYILENYNKLKIDIKYKKINNSLFNIINNIV